MESIVRIKQVDVKNIKNVKHGYLKTNTEFDNMHRANIIGLYGQNGSGKTALVEAFSLLKDLLNCSMLPEKSENLILQGQEFVELYFEFYITNKFGDFTVKYTAKLKSGEERLKVIDEMVSYKENIPGKRFKEIISNENGVIQIRKNRLKSFASDIKLKVMLSSEMSQVNHTGFVFKGELTEAFEGALTEEEIELMSNLIVDFNKDFHVIDNEQNGLILANISMPMSIHVKNFQGKIPYRLSGPVLLPKDAFETIENVVGQINVVVGRLIPGLQVVANPIHKETLENGSEGIRFEFLSNRNGLILPLRCESAGILKLISILSTLIAVYNKPNACVVVDELDSGVFEYLLGEILEVIDTTGKGQLFFTSHNLRLLEVLSSKNLWFTTMNEENRFIQLRGVKQLSNARDVYLRAVQLGGQDEELYKETDHYDIKNAFRKAGNTND